MPHSSRAVSRILSKWISGFGQSGPYRGRPGFARVGEAVGGHRFINGYPNRPPPRFGIPLGDTVTALFAFEGLRMAQYWRDARGGAWAR